jgi:hypothetical protein
LTIKSIEISGRLTPGTAKDLEVIFTYYHQLEEIDQMPFFSSSYINLLGPIKPYQQFTIYLSKNFINNKYSMFGGVDLRRLVDEDDESEFNHSFYHAYIASSVENLFLKGLQLTLQGDIWQQQNKNSDDEMIITGGGEIAYEISRKARFRLGSFYTLYQYDYYEDDDEHTDVYTIFSDARYVFTNQIYIACKYELDIYDIYEHRFTLTTGYQF